MFIIVIFNWLNKKWESKYTHRFIGMTVSFCFVLGLGLIELNRRHILPPTLEFLPTNHLVAIKWAFTFLMVFEVMSLIFTLPASVSVSMGKQLELFSLILLRDVFTEFSKLHEPLIWTEIRRILPAIGWYALGGFTIFIILGFFYRIHQYAPVIAGAKEQTSFIRLKKLTSLFLLIIFIGLIGTNIWKYLLYNHPEFAFETFFTVLIFSDIFFVLASLTYSRRYCILFRNAGFAVATLLLRLGFLGPPYMAAILGVSATLFALGITIVYNTFAPMSFKKKHLRSH